METSDENAFGKWIENVIENHKNPVVKLPLQRSKQFKIGEGDAQQIKSKLDVLKTTLSSERVEVKTSRTRAEWIEKLRLVKVTHLVGTKIQTMGFQNVTGKYLHVFEALFLLETNRLEIMENNIPWTVNKAYSILLKSKRDLEEYVGYRKLALLGFDLKCNNVEEIVEHAAKKFKASTSTDNPEPTNLAKVFEDLKSQGPKKHSGDLNAKTDTSWNFKYGDECIQPLEFIIENEFDSTLILRKDEQPTVICITCGETTFAEVVCTELPDIPFGINSN